MTSSSVTTGHAASTAERGGRPADGWRASGPELAIAAIVVVAVTGAAYAWAGLAGGAMVLGCCAVLALALLRLLPDAEPEHVAPPEEWAEPTHTSISGFWRERNTVKDATTNMASYEVELRPVLQHLLAARLAERHGISLYTDPEAARRLLLAGGRDKNLWYWLDPQRPEAPENRAGIPPRTLAAIIHRLEQL